MLNTFTGNKKKEGVEKKIEKADNFSGNTPYKKPKSVAKQLLIGNNCLYSDAKIIRKILISLTTEL